MNQKIRTNKKLGDNLRKIRKNSHLTQEDVTARLQLRGINISRSIYAQIECGTYNIRVTELAALTEIFQTDYNNLFDGISSIEQQDF